MSEKNIIIWAVLACVFLAGLPSPVAGTDVIVSQCSKEENKQEDMRCAHKLLQRIRNPSADCGAELKKFMECVRNFTMGKCYGDYLKTHKNMKDPMKRMAGIRARRHNFGRLLCGIEPDVNTTGLPKNITDMLKCNKVFFDGGKQCAKTFHDKFKANRNSTDLCKLFMEAKICMGGLMKEHCTFDKPPPRDRFNPFCPDMKDPRPHAGTGKAFTSVALTFMALVLHLLL